MFWTVRDSRQVKNAKNTQIKYNSKTVNNTKYSQTNNPGLVAFYVTRPGNITTVSHYHIYFRVSTNLAEQIFRRDFKTCFHCFGLLCNLYRISYI